MYSLALALAIGEIGLDADVVVDNVDCTGPVIAVDNFSNYSLAYVLRVAAVKVLGMGSHGAPRPGETRIHPVSGTIVRRPGKYPFSTIWVEKVQIDHVSQLARQSVADYQGIPINGLPPLESRTEDC
jgi:hypothetical protein